MGIGVSVFFIAVGAILTYALQNSVKGIDISTVGVILMLVGGLGLAWSALLLQGRRSSSRTTYSNADGAPIAQRDTIVRDSF